MGFGWEVERKMKRIAKQILPKLKTLDYPYGKVYSFVYGHQNLIKLILYENRYL